MRLGRDPAMQSFDLYSIGHSNIPADRFIAMLRGAGVDAVADVRSSPFSRRFPWFSAKNLAPRLQQDGVLYLPFGDALGGRPRDPGLYCDGIADYEAMARRDALRAEREPLDCHRCLLVTRALAERAVAVGHILHDGTIEPHAATEQRLLALDAPDGDLFVTASDRLADAYRRRARAVAYRAKPGSPGGA
jgi:uncharacterized protein (DUF488 family)